MDAKSFTTLGLGANPIEKSLGKFGTLFSAKQFE
jgi:hypothetical protein